MMRDQVEQALGECLAGRDGILERGRQRAHSRAEFWRGVAAFLAAALFCFAMLYWVGVL